MMEHIFRQCQPRQWPPRLRFGVERVAEKSNSVCLWLESVMDHCRFIVRIFETRRCYEPLSISRLVDSPYV